MRGLFIILFCTIIGVTIQAQEFEVPKNYTLVKAEDYAPYEKDVIACVNWLQKTPANEQNSLRADVNIFLMKWLSGSPNIHIEIKPEVVTFMGANPDLLMLFMGGCQK